MPFQVPAASEVVRTISTHPRRNGICLDSRGNLVDPPRNPPAAFDEELPGDLLHAGEKVAEDADCEANGVEERFNRIVSDEPARRDLVPKVVAQIVRAGCDASCAWVASRPTRGSTSWVSRLSSRISVMSWPGPGPC